MSDAFAPSIFVFLLTLGGGGGGGIMEEKF